ncbi:GNAT family N-acetyltransferase [Alicyclobacillus vulcanalis]|uniref:Acetyltransferase (GNAT) family protein n=1 Tax=Alicyclobacillus vulcanalis TaxID=252246 RepID=A0A1N7JZX8_9BACL|nr:GNAT family N-acetyltransferase [Alicyclobacillus vulcanalis]SIS54878.1 Acetyltransferase (GNAT) family protein [Alicyclobacillus vulcanalis]
MQRRAREACQLLMNDWEALDGLYERFHGDPDWPFDARAPRAWQSLVQSWQMGAWLGDTAVAIAVQAGEPAGYASLTPASVQEPSLGRAWEVGTYVAPNHRGTHVNGLLKRWAAEEALRFGARWLVACIPFGNHRAAGAFLKVFPEASVYDESTAGPWRLYLRRRSFAAGQPTRLYVVQLQSLSSPT